MLGTWCRRQALGSTERGLRGAPTTSQPPAPGRFERSSEQPSSSATATRYFNDSDLRAPTFHLAGAKRQRLASPRSAFRTVAGARGERILCAGGPASAAAAPR
eukprot:2684852-Pyramimonas_sp.AAC.1